MEYGVCESKISDSKIVLIEKKAKITFLNSKNVLVRKVIIDDCVIKDGKRCDYLIIRENKEYAFIELKGSDVAYAVTQIEETIDKLKIDNFNRMYAFVVTYRCPLTTTEIQNLAKKMSKRKCSLKVLGSNKEIDIGF